MLRTFPISLRFGNFFVATTVCPPDKDHPETDLRLELLVLPYGCLSLRFSDHPSLAQVRDACDELLSHALQAEGRSRFPPPPP